jgi:prepilin-type N-terminal cleavage/methylation domain-containing protein
MKGFTLIEILVSVAIFSIVMVMALGALLAMSTADHRAELLKSALNNLNFALDSMSRDVRTGWAWGCNSTPGTNCQSPGANEFVYTSADYGQVLYKYDTSTSDCGQATGAVGCIARSTDGGNHWAAVTAPEVVIQNLSGCSAGTTPCLFYLVGAPAGSTGDTVQPKLTITLSGYVQLTPTQQSPINLQTTVTQRLYDQ